MAAADDETNSHSALSVAEDWCLYSDAALWIYCL